MLKGPPATSCYHRLPHYHDEWNRWYKSERWFDHDQYGDGVSTSGANYNHKSQITLTGDDNHHFRHLDYDTANRLSVTTDPKGNTRTITEYDANSNPHIIRGGRPSRRGR